MVLFAFSILLFFSTSIVLSAETSLLTTIRLKEEYNSNILFTESKANDDFISYVIPSLKLKYATEILNLSALADWNAMFYWNNSDLNTINQRYGLESSYRLTERWSVSADGRFVKDTTLDSQLDETGSVGKRQNRYRYNADGGVAYAMSERTEVGADYAFQKTDYQRKSSVDTTYQTISVYYQHKLQNEKDTISIFPKFGWGDSDDFDAYNSSLNLRWEHPFSETLDTSILVGVRNTSVDYKDDRGNTTDWGGIADMWLRKKGEVTTGLLGFSNDLRTRSNGEIINVSRLYTNIDHRLSRRFGLGFRGNIYYSNLIEDSPENDDDRWYFDVSPSAFYRLTEDHLLRLLYSFNQQTELDRKGNPKKDRHRIWLQLTFNFPKTW